MLTKTIILSLTITKYRIVKLRFQQTLLLNRSNLKFSWNYPNCIVKI
jgi:hypothetical protein